MHELIIYCALTVLLYLLVDRMSLGLLRKERLAYDTIRLEHEQLQHKHRTLTDANARTACNLQMTTALYDITKDICKSLDEEEVFRIFHNEIHAFVDVHDCRLFDDKAKIPARDNELVYLLEIDKENRRFLVFWGGSEEDRKKCDILTHQLFLALKRAILYRRVQELAITDALTGIFGRRYFMERLSEELRRCKDFSLEFSFLMMDVDRFKYFNDRYGHLVGDAILKEVTKTVKENIRQIDLFGRYGGEEFAIILTETNKEGALFAAERIRQAMENKKVKIYDENLSITLSIGISVFPHDAANSGELVDRADQALYRAKNSGRNKTCVFS